MITKQQYDAGMNPTATPWMLLPESTKQVIETVAVWQYLAANGEWTGCGRGRAQGVAYRIHPDTPYKRPGVVEAQDIKGLTLRYDEHGNAGLVITGSNKRSCCISVAAIIDAFERVCLGGGLLKSALMCWANDNRPEE